MKNWIKNPNFNLKTAIIAGIVLFSLVLPNIAQAGFFESIGKEILYTLGEAIHYVLNWVLKAAAAFFEGMLDIGFKQALGVIKIGWQVARDFSNMFFILFLIIAAFATILRIEQYGIKQLLPKVIIIALLINFSFVIAGIIIDFSNIAADFFIRDIRGRIAGRGVIAATFADSLGVGALYQTFTDCDEFQTEGYRQCEEYAQAYANLPSILPGMQRGDYLRICRAIQDDLVTECNEYGIITVRNESLKEVSFFSLFLSMTVGSVVMLIAAFALFAGGVLLLIRMIVLWLLVIVVPFVFACYIMPGLRRIWQKWWSSFLSWCFFAPAYAFFVWLAIQISISRANKVLGGVAQNASSGDWGASANPFVANPGQQLISYGIIVAFLLGGLIMARQMGIYGAKTAISVGQRLAGVERVKRYIKARKAVREEEKKEAVKRKLRLRETGGLRQAIKERVPGEIGRRARARRANIIKTESKRLAKLYSINDIRKIAGYRGFTGYRRSYRLAATKALADEKLSKEIAALSKAQKERIDQLTRRLEKKLSRYPATARKDEKEKEEE